VDETIDAVRRALALASGYLEGEELVAVASALTADAVRDAWAAYGPAAQ
jgi:hypothetical protein